MISDSQKQHLRAEWEAQSFSKPRSLHISAYYLEFFVKHHRSKRTETLCLDYCVLFINLCLQDSEATKNLLTSSALSPAEYDFLVQIMSFTDVDILQELYISMLSTLVCLFVCLLDTFSEVEQVEEFKVRATSSELVDIIQEVWR